VRLCHLRRLCDPRRDRTQGLRCRALLLFTHPKGLEGYHMAHPNQQQRQFFQDIIAGQGGTILTLKRVEDQTQALGFSVNIRGPFMLDDYKFKTSSETVIDAEWANSKAKMSNTQESDSHIHCTWDYWNFAVLSDTSNRVKETIEYDYQLAFFKEKSVATVYADANANAAVNKNNKALFWFYLKDKTHRACICLPKNQVIDISTWPAQSLCP
jgi:hypothetical protein